MTTLRLFLARLTLAWVRVNIQYQTERKNALEGLIERLEGKA